ncbi:hypothetical protein [Ferrimonas marina]|uniref:Uncharacterized protein n=1 Tax=Ferrimonas marina TaxID=299255 RepID=A0A1M5TBD3_9GAMM|nr:hypothetical protein [Ferrimonas marina]SHH48115.1 hypothetical protein SAMN02745129_2073 [Ferrimonas marina]
MSDTEFNGNNEQVPERALESIPLEALQAMDTEASAVDPESNIQTEQAVQAESSVHAPDPESIPQTETQRSPETPATPSAQDQAKSGKFANGEETREGSNPTHSMYLKASDLMACLRGKPDTEYSVNGLMGLLKIEADQPLATVLNKLDEINGSNGSLKRGAIEQVFKEVFGLDKALSEEQVKALPELKSDPSNLMNEAIDSLYDGLHDNTPTISPLIYAVDSRDNDGNIPDLSDGLKSALEKAGIKPGKLTRDEVKQANEADEHGRGKRETEEEKKKKQQRGVALDPLSAAILSGAKGVGNKFKAHRDKQAADKAKKAQEVAAKQIKHFALLGGKATQVRDLLNSGNIAETMALLRNNPDLAKLFVDLAHDNETAGKSMSEGLREAGFDNLDAKEARKIMSDLYEQSGKYLSEQAQSAEPDMKGVSDVINGMEVLTSADHGSPVPGLDSKREVLSKGATELSSKKGSELGADDKGKLEKLKESIAAIVNAINAAISSLTGRK